MKAWTALAALAFLAACEDGAPERNVTPVKAVNPYSDQLKGMSELYRNLGLRRAITDNNQRCKRVDRGGYQQQYQTMAMWAVHCTDSGDWAIYLAPNGQVQVSRCQYAKQLGLPECRVPAATAPEPAEPKAKAKEKSAR
jgi:hypothetical protein